ncbi:MAG: hypothetical protein EOQ96_31735, partial [Mesorhizobium sp.]
GYTQGRDLQTCGDLGSLAAGLVIQQIGPRPRQNLRREAEQAGLLQGKLFPSPPVGEGVAEGDG